MSNKKIETFLKNYTGDTPDLTWAYNGLAAMATVEYQLKPILIVDWREAEGVLPDIADVGIRVYERTYALKLVNALDKMTDSVSETTTAIKKIMRNYNPEQVPILILSGQGSFLRRRLGLANPFVYPDDARIQIDGSSDNIDAINRLKLMGWYKRMLKKFNQMQGEPKLYTINWMHSEYKIPVVTLISLESRTIWGVYHFFGNPEYVFSTVSSFIEQTWGGDFQVEPD